MIALFIAKLLAAVFRVQKNIADLLQPAADVGTVPGQAQFRPTSVAGHEVGTENHRFLNARIPAVLERQNDQKTCAFHNECVIRQ